MGPVAEPHQPADIAQGFTTAILLHESITGALLDNFAPRFSEQITHTGAGQARKPFKSNVKDRKQSRLLK